MLLLQVVEMAPEPNHRAENIRYTAGWQRRRDCVVRLPRLVAERGQARGELGRLEVVPQSFPQCFGGEQVELGVEPGQPAAGRRDLVAPQVTHGFQHGTDPVELPGDGVRAGLDSALQLLGLAAQPQPSLGPPGVLLPVRASVARMSTQPPPHLEHPRRRRRRPAAAGVAASPPWNGTFALSAAARSRRDVAAFGLNVPGIRSRASGSTATGKSTSESRRTCRAR